MLRPAVPKAKVAPAPVRVKHEAPSRVSRSRSAEVPLYSQAGVARQAFAELVRLDPSMRGTEQDYINAETGIMNIDGITEDIQETRRRLAQQQEELERVPVGPSVPEERADRRPTATGFALTGTIGPAGRWVEDSASEVSASEMMRRMGRGPEVDPLMDWAAEDEVDIERFYRGRAFPPVHKHTNRLRAEVVLQQNYEALNAVHLLQTDRGFSQPVMGAVHYVQAARHFSDKHFMHDVEGDINEGQKVLVERARRGPFKDQTGRSTVMDRSAHVTYRKRAGAFEITARRGVTHSEMQQLLSKLSIHRMSIHGSHLVIIKGSKRYRLGPLAEINLKYLTELVRECIDQYGSCGLEITESRAGVGALYKPGAHSARFKSNARKGRGAPAVRR